MGSVPVLAMETHGAHSLNATLEANEVVVLDGIKSIAKSLGSAKVADQCLPVIKNHKGPVYSKLCHDTEAIDGKPLMLLTVTYYTVQRSNNSWQITDSLSNQHVAHRLQLFIADM